MDERFSPRAFSEASDPKGLAEELVREVGFIIQPAIEAAMANVVAQLNELGHALQIEHADLERGVCYDTPGDKPYFYLCHDSTVSAGVRRD